MAHPLEVSYNWRTPVLFATVGLMVCLAVLVHGRVAGWGLAAAVLLALWLVLVGLVYLRSRAYLLVEGSRLTIRRFRSFQVIDGDQLVKVSQFLTPSGPCYRLTVRGPDGHLRRVVAPVALLRKGHSTLFGWILAHAPGAELDRGSVKTLNALQTRGLVSSPPPGRRPE